jgi:Xaa-Pro aminopeptidase
VKKHFQEVLEATPAFRSLPFPEAEFADRLRRVRREMSARKIDLLFLSAPESIFYLTGFQCEWYQAQSGRAFPPTSGIAIAADREEFIHFETPSEAILSHVSTISKDIRIFPLGARRDGQTFILRELSAAGMLKGTVGLERYSYRPNPVISDKYVAAFESAGLKVVDATDLLRDLRRIKSPLEMKCIEEATRIADIGMRAAEATIRPGVTELEVFGEIIAAMTRAGGEFPGILPPVVSGFRSNCSHPIASRKVIEKGERVNVDVSGVYNRYHSNMARSFHVGEPPKPVLDFHNRIVGVFKIIEAMIRPGMEVSALLHAANDYYKNEGVLDEAYWIGGYELGIAFPPDWVGAFIYDDSITAPGEIFEPMTVVNHESVFFAPLKSGLSLTIDTLIFGPRDAKLASTIPRELRILGA